MAIIQAVPHCARRSTLAEEALCTRFSRGMYNVFISGLFWGVHNFQERHTGEHTELHLGKVRGPVALSPVTSLQNPLAAAPPHCCPSSVPVHRTDVSWRFEGWATQTTWWEKGRRVENPPFSEPCVKFEFIARYHTFQIRHQIHGLLF